MFILTSSTSSQFTIQKKQKLHFRRRQYAKPTDKKQIRDRSIRLSIYRLENNKRIENNINNSNMGNKYNGI